MIRFPTYLRAGLVLALWVICGLVNLCGALSMAELSDGTLRYLLLAATGDEILDWREMTARYAGAHQHVIEGSDHGLSDFDDYLQEVLAFCNA